MDALDILRREVYVQGCGLSPAGLSITVLARTSYVGSVLNVSIGRYMTFDVVDVTLKILVWDGVGINGNALDATSSVVKFTLCYCSPPAR
jgi:hypothetical protein